MSFRAFASSGFISLCVFPSVAWSCFCHLGLLRESWVASSFGLHVHQRTVLLGVHEPWLLALPGPPARTRLLLHRHGRCCRAHSVCSVGPGFVIPELFRLALVPLKLAPSLRRATHQQRPRDKALFRITCPEAGADQAGRLGAAARKTSRPWSSRALPRATSYPGWVGRSQVCASTGRYCISPESCPSYSHPALHVSARSARLAYPHTAHRFEIDRAPPPPNPGLNLCPPTRPAARLRLPISHTRLHDSLSPSRASQRAQPRSFTWSIGNSPSSCNSGHVCLACAGRLRTASTSISYYAEHKPSCLVTRPSDRQALMTLRPPLSFLSRLSSCGKPDSGQGIC